MIAFDAQPPFKKKFISGVKAHVELNDHMNKNLNFKYDITL